MGLKDHRCSVRWPRDRNLASPTLMPGRTAHAHWRKPLGGRSMKEETAQPNQSVEDVKPAGGMPTPVRAMMGASESLLPSDPDESLAAIEIEGDRWIALALGSTRSGTVRDRGAPLLLIGFARAEQPDVCVREALGVAETVAELGSHELADLFARSRPYRPADTGHDDPVPTKARGSAPSPSRPD